MHVHIDKPAGESLPQFRRILDAAARKKLLVQMGYMFRYNPAVVLLREFLKKGWLGEVFEVHAVMSKVVSPPGKRLAAFPGGMMFEPGLPRPRPRHRRSGPAEGGHLVQPPLIRVDDGLLDNMLAVLGYPRAIASIKSSAAGSGRLRPPALVVCGTEGTFISSRSTTPAARVSLSRAPRRVRKGTQDLTFPKYVRHVDDAADMARVIRGETASDFSHEHDSTVQETLLKACGLSLKD